MEPNPVFIHHRTAFSKRHVIGFSGAQVVTGENVGNFAINQGISKL
jgi:hypothetical protein